MTTHIQMTLDDVRPEVVPFQFHESRIPVRIFVTRNVRSPVLALYGKWTARAAFTRMARAGVYIATRLATVEEGDYVEQQVRLTAGRWDSIAAMLTDEVDLLEGRPGALWFSWLIDGLKRNERQVVKCLKGIEAKKRRKARGAN